MDWTKLNQARANLMRVNPNAGLASLGIGVIAPKLISNDDRGYVESALITTPLVAAGTAAFQATQSLINKEAKTYKGFIQDAYQRVSEQDKSPMTASRFTTILQEYEKGNVRSSQMRRAMKEYYFSSKPKVSNFNEALNTLQGNVNSAWDGEFSPFELGARERYLENSIHASMLQSLSMQDLVGYKKLGGNKPVAPILGRQGIERVIAEQINARNEAFVKKMNFHFVNLGKTNFVGQGTTLAANQATSKITKHSWSALDWKKPELLNGFRESHPQLFDAIQSNIKSGAINENRFKVVYDGANPIGFEYGKNKISIVGENGRIVAGKNWDKSGVARGFWDLQGKYKTDLFAINNINLPGLKEDLARAYLIDGIDSTDSWGSNLAEGESRRISDLEAKLLSSSYVGRNTGGFQGDKGASALQAEQIQEAISKSEALGLESTGSEGGLAKLVLQDKSMLQHNYFNLQDPARQSSSSRSLSKPVRLTNISEGLEPYAVTDFAQHLNDGERLPVMGIRVAGVTAQQKTFFGELPSSVNDLASYEETAVQKLMKMHSLEERQARGAWKSLSRYLSDPRNLAAARKLSYMGQPSKLMRPGLAEIVEKKSYTGHEYLLGGLNPGDTIPNNTPLVYSNGNAINAGGQRAILDGYRVNSDGTYTVDVSEYNDLNFAKLDPNSGKRGSMIELGEGETERLARGLSIHNTAISNRATISPDIHGFVLDYQDSAKGDVRNAIVNMTSETMRTLQETGQTDLYEKYSSKLSDLGFLDGRTMTYESAAANATLTTRTRGIQAFDELVSVSNQLMSEAGERIQQLARESPNVLSRTMKNFVSSGKSLEEFYTTASIPMDASVWDTTLRNQASEVRVTNEMIENLSLRGYHASAKDLIENSEVKGDISLNEQMSAYLSGDKNAISKTMSAREALGRDPRRIRLSSAEGRLGSIFEEGAEKGADNFIMKFKNGEEVPMLGNNAYKGGTNRYGVGDFSATDLERHTWSMTRADAKGDRAAFDKARSLYNEALENIQSGKNSYLRPEAIRKNAVGGFLQSRAAENPFEVGLGRDYLAKITDRSVKDALLAGETVTGTFARYPVLNMPVVNYKLDDNLKNGNFGITEDLAMIVQGDHDQDRGFAAFFQPGSEAHNEVVAAMSSDKQLNEMKQWQSAQKEATEELAKNWSQEAESLEARAHKWRKAIMNTTQTRQNRLVNATIGEFSNTYSMLRMGIAQNKNITSSADRNMLNVLMSEIYQTPISATKGKAGNISLFEARNINRSLSQSVEGGFDEFYGALSRAYSFAAKSSQNALEDHKDLLRDYHAGLPEDLSSVSKALTGSRMSYGGKTFTTIEDSVKATNMLPYLKRGEEVVENSGKFSQVSSEALGAINEATSSWKTIARAAKDSGAFKILAAGGVLAAGVGLLRTNIEVPKASTKLSTERRRPEYTEASSNNIPGEPAAGSYSSNPPKTQVTTNGSPVNSVMVAPIHQTNDVEVSLKADDRSRAAQTTKIIAKLSNAGNTTVTNNYKGNTNLRSLRNRQKIRDAMDES